MFRKIKEYFTHEDKKIRDDRWIFASMLVGAICSLAAALILSIEAYELAKNATVQLSCNINTIISCGTVASSSYASLLGFPNSYLGLMCEPIVITVAIAGLSGVKFPRLFMAVAQFFYTLGFIFAYYLFTIGLLVVHAVCPWCMLVTLSTTFVFFAITRYNIRENNLYFSKKTAAKARALVDKDYDKLIMAILAVAILAILIVRYGSGLFA